MKRAIIALFSLFLCLTAMSQTAEELGLLDLQAYDLQNYTEAIRYWQQAAEQGDAHAQFNLGSCYQGGIGVKENPEAAFEWYMKAAEQGFEPAEEALKEISGK